MELARPTDDLINFRKMPIYICYHGDCDNLAHQQAEGTPFIAKDAAGVTWLCVETTLSEMPLSLPDSVLEMIQAQNAAHRQGLSTEGSAVKLLDCPDEEAVRRRLVLESYPPSGDSMAALVQAGWDVNQSWRTGEPHKVSVTKGWHTVSAEGETENEAWYRTTQKVFGIRRPGQETSVMPFTIQTDPVPLRVDEYDVIRVGDSQVLLDTVIREFNNGADPEAIVHGYSTLNLADVYDVVAYYLRHREEVDEYLRARREQAQKLREEIEAKQPGQAELRAKLLARKARMELDHASPRK